MTAVQPSRSTRVDRLAALADEVRARGLVAVVDEQHHTVEAIQAQVVAEPIGGAPGLRQLVALAYNAPTDSWWWLFVWDAGDGGGVSAICPAEDTGTAADKIAGVLAVRGDCQI